MNIVFRTDASVKIGTGHVMRCLTLAKSLRERNCKIDFICREHEGNLIEKITSEGFKVSVLENSKLFEIENDQLILDHSDWLGTSWQQDAIQSIEAIDIDTHTFDWLVVDHYALDKRWEDKLRPYAKKIMVIDDLADREHSCDLLLDQNWKGNGTTSLSLYNELVPLSSKKLIGPKYALLGESFTQLRKSSNNRSGNIARLLIFLGGSDEENLTGKILNVICEDKFSFLTVDVVLGKNFRHLTELKQIINCRLNCNVHRNLPTLSYLMKKADIMIGAGGICTWERMCLGLPSIVISVASNQVLMNQRLSEAKLITHLGEISQVSKASIRNSLVYCLDNSEEMKKQSESAMKLVTGEGSNLVCDSILN